MKTIADMIESLLEAAKQSNEGLHTKVTIKLDNNFSRDIATVDLVENFRGMVVVLE